MTWKDRLLGRRPPGPEPLVADDPHGVYLRGTDGGPGIYLREITPHGGDLHFVSAVVAGTAWRDYLYTGDLNELKPGDAQRVIAARVRALVRS